MELGGTSSMLYFKFELSLKPKSRENMLRPLNHFATRYEKLITFFIVGGGEDIINKTDTQFLGYIEQVG